MGRHKLSEENYERRLDEAVAGKLDPEEDAYAVLQRESDAKALRMRLSGAQYREIANALGFAGPSGAHQAVQRELRRRLVEPANDLREIELMRLDRMQTALWAVVLRSEKDPNFEFADLEKAIARLLALSRRRSELTGIDAPKKIDITKTIRDMAAAEGLDPDQAVRDAETLIARASK